MPLFGSSHTDNKLEKPHHHHATEMDGTGYGTGPGATGAGTGPGLGRTHDPRLANDPLSPSTGTMGMGEPGMGNPGMGNPGMGATGGGRHHMPAGNNTTAGMHNDGMMGGPQYGAAGAGTGTGVGVGGPAIPPTGALSGAGQQPHSGGSAMTGKIEHAVGSLVGSKTLKAKGIQKEQEAQGLKVQSQELAEAERLEREAGMRRERAVAHGAHPDNRHVGGNVPGAGAGAGPGTYN